MRRGPARHPLRSAARVAGVATALVAAVSVAGVAGLDALAVHRLDAEVDLRVSDQLTESSTVSVATLRSGHFDPDGVPVFTWRLDRSGAELAATTGAPAITPRTFWHAAGLRTVTLAGARYRVAAARERTGWVVTGQNLASVDHVLSVLLTAEGLAAPLVLLAVFLGALAIGVRAATPVEAARRRQRDFTADASHELRTPLSVIEAELSLARAAPRSPAEYVGTLERIGAESGRLRHIVEDLLWLARFDAAPPAPAREPVDLGTIAAAGAARFEPVARGRGVAVTTHVDPERPVLVHAPPEWVDRLVGVLVDNACRYAGTGGRVAVWVGAEAGRAVLAVEDTGPGVAPDERNRLFDRFHRATDEHEGHGLGLAIADSVVRATGGRWQVADAALGGARFEVSWPPA